MKKKQELEVLLKDLDLIGKRAINHLKDKANLPQEEAESKLKEIMMNVQIARSFLCLIYDKGYRVGKDFSFLEEYQKHPSYQIFYRQLEDSLKKIKDNYEEKRTSKLHREKKRSSFATNYYSLLRN